MDGREKCLGNSENPSNLGYGLGHLEDKRPSYDSTSFFRRCLLGSVRKLIVGHLLFHIRPSHDLTPTRCKRYAASRMSTVRRDFRPDFSVGSACSNLCPGYTRLELTIPAAHVAASTLRQRRSSCLRASNNAYA